MNDITVWYVVFGLPAMLVIVALIIDEIEVEE